MEANQVQNALAIMGMRYAQIGLHSVNPKEKLLSWVKPEDRNNISREIERIEKTEGVGFVYFVQDTQTLLIKIGYAKDVKSRLSSLQTGCPTELKLVLAISGGISLERELHKEFSNYRFRGEWFLPMPRITGYIKDRGGFVFGDAPPFFIENKPDDIYNFIDLCDGCVHGRKTALFNYGNGMLCSKFEVSEGVDCDGVEEIKTYHPAGLSANDSAGVMECSCFDAI